MKKALITGITGFAGSFLAENLVNSGNFEVIGTYLSDNGISNLNSVKDHVTLKKQDLQDVEGVKALISEVRPDYVFHLAALAATADSYANPAKFINNNIDSQVNLLEGIRLAEITPRTLIVSSAEVYGDVKASDLPIDEQTSIRPVNPYGVSKVAQDFMGLQYYISYKIPVIRVRPFNHIGPRQAPNFAVPTFAKKIAEIEKGKMEPVLLVGNLNAKRDFTDVRDMVEAYAQIIDKGTPGEVYNIGSGKAIQISDILEKLMSFSDKPIQVEPDQSLYRPIDVEELVCDNSKIREACGWEPKISIDQTLKETLEYWRNQE